MDPLIGASLISFFGSALSGRLGASSANNSFSKSLAAQRLLAKDQFGYQQQLMNKQFAQNQGLMRLQNFYNTLAQSSQNDFAASMAARSQDWTRQNMNLSSKLEYQNWLNAFNEQNAYNDPAAQRARLEAAGYNPQLANGSVNTVGGTGMSSSPSASAPQTAVGSPLGVSGQSVSLGEVGQGSAPSLNLADSINSTANALANISNAVVQANLSKHEIKKKISEVRKNIASAAIDEMTVAVGNMPFTDEGAPTHDNGQPYTLAEAKESGLVSQAFKMIAKLKSESNINAWEGLLKGQEFFQLQKTNPDAALAIKQAAQNAIKQGQVLDEQVGYIQEQTKTQKEETNKVHEEATTIKKLRPAQIAQAWNDAKLAAEKIKTEKANQKYLASGSAKNYADARLSDQQVKNLKGQLQRDSYRFFEKVDIALDTAHNQKLISDRDYLDRLNESQAFQRDYANGSVGDFSRFAGHVLSGLLPILGAIKF